MKTYYSILSISPNPAMNERFNVGLLCVAPDRTYFHFSASKVKVVSKLLRPNAAKLVLAALEGIHAKINASVEENSTLFPNERLPMLSESYLNYLHRYNNNLLQFTATVDLDIEMSQETFEFLFRKYIYCDEIFVSQHKEKVASFTSIRKQFQRLATPYANTNYPVSHQVIPGMLVPVIVDVFGKNCSFVSGHSMDFEKQYHTLQNDLSSYLYLVENTKKVDSDSTCFLLANEPPKNELPNHDLWSSIRNSNLVKVVPVNESEQIIDFMKEKGVQPII